MALSVDIKKRLGSFRLEVAFDTDREILALLGGSGCGKSMTLKCIAGIETPDSGRIVLDGRTLYDSERHIDLSPQRRRVGYLFQQYALFPNMTVEQNIMAGVRAGSRCEKRSAAEAMLRSLRLEGMEKKRPNQLSGGQQQRVALARILVNGPDVLLLDEPFSALDSYLKWQLELELSDTLRSFGKDVIYVSHDRDEVFRLCSSVCVLTAGRSEPKSGVRELFRSPGTVSAARLSGCKNISPAQKTADGGALCPSWGVTLRLDGERAEFDSVGIRAHSLHPARAGDVNLIPCTVERVVEDMFATVLMLKAPGGDLLRMELPPQRCGAYMPGQSLCVSVDEADIMTLVGDIPAEEINI